MERPALNRLIDIVAKLRDPQKGCPWDLKQNHESLLPYLIEESYEFADAVGRHQSRDMEEELGDLLLQVLLHAQIASETEAFNLESVAQRLAEKLVRRHPHVFASNGETLTPEQVQQRWGEIKQAEKKDQGPIIGRRYLHHPALTSAHKIGEKTRELNFDWEDASQVVYKVEEEWQELKEEIIPGQHVNQERIAEELGDFLFSTAQLARHVGVDPEDALRSANEKFIKRFAQVEQIVKEKGESFEELTQAELDQYWNIVKKKP